MDQQNPEQDRRLLVAIGLSIAVYFAWTTFFGPPVAPPVETPASPSPSAQATPAGAPEAGSPPASAASVPEAQIQPHGKTLTGTGWTAEVHSSNGAMHSLSLTDYSAPPHVTPIWTAALAAITGKGWDWQPYQGGDEPERLISDGGAFGIAGAGPFDEDGAASAAEPSRYTVTQTGEAITATRVRPDGLVITKTWKAGPTPYSAELEVRFENKGSAELPSLWVGVVDRLGEGHDRATQAMVMRPVSYIDEDLEKLDDITDLAGPEEETWEGPVSWAGLGNTYFLATLVPEDSSALKQVIADDLPSGRVGSFMVDSQPLPPGQSRVHRFQSYNGPKVLDHLRAQGHDLDEAVDYGWFGFFAKAFLFVMVLYEKAVKNWGLAIILLTLTFNLVFWPLQKKSSVAMQGFQAKQQAIQPKLKELQEKYKDDQQTLSQEMFKLYAEHKINPLGGLEGCWPQLVRIPLWIAMYNVILSSVEIYDSSFLYLKDLTGADPYGALPLIYTGLSWYLQSMTQMTGLDESQQKVMKFMPIIFAVFMFTFPSGVVLYSTCNMLLTIVQQWLLRRERLATTPAMF
jgi:YidC/Oxa1 family membrane protein insertase